MIILNPTPLKAIRRKCLECMGSSAPFVATCHERSCGLHPYRMGRIPEGASPRLLAVIRQFCLACAGTSDGVKGCTAGPDCEAQGYVPCPLWRYRLGRSPNITMETRIARAEAARKQGWGTMQKPIPAGKNTQAMLPLSN